MPRLSPFVSGAPAPCLHLAILARRRKWLTLTEEGWRLYEIMHPQTDKVADYLLSELSGGQIAQLQTVLARLIDTLEARDEQGQSLFLERTKPASE